MFYNKPTEFRCHEYQNALPLSLNLEESLKREFLRKIKLSQGSAWDFKSQCQQEKLRHQSAKVKASFDNLKETGIPFGHTAKIQIVRLQCTSRAKAGAARHAHTQCYSFGTVQEMPNWELTSQNQLAHFKLQTSQILCGATMLWVSLQVLLYCRFCLAVFFYLFPGLFFRPTTSAFPRHERPAMDSSSTVASVVHRNNARTGDIEAISPRNSLKRLQVSLRLRLSHPWLYSYISYIAKYLEKPTHQPSFSFAKKKKKTETLHHGL